MSSDERVNPKFHAQNYNPKNEQGDSVAVQIPVEAIELGHHFAAVHIDVEVLFQNFEFFGVAVGDDEFVGFHATEAPSLTEAGASKRDLQRGHALGDFLRGVQR